MTPAAHTNRHLDTGTPRTSSSQLVFLLSLPARPTATAQLMCSQPASQRKRDCPVPLLQHSDLRTRLLPGGLHGVSGQALPGSACPFPAAPSPANHPGLVAAVPEQPLGSVPAACKPGSWGILAARLPSAPRDVFALKCRKVDSVVPAPQTLLPTLCDAVGEAPRGLSSDAGTGKLFCGLE